MEFINGNFVFEKADFEPFCDLLFESLQNDLFILNECNISDFQRKKVKAHTEHCLTLVRMFFASLHIDNN